MQTLKKGFLIAIEGVDGSGKSTLIKNLQEILRHFHPLIITQEPDGTAIGKQIHTLVREKATTNCPLTEYLLFAAARAQHFHDIILPALQNNSLIISDRMADSSLIYQGYVQNLETNIIETINRWAMQEAVPNLTLYLRVSAETALLRIKQRMLDKDYLEQKYRPLLTRLVKGFDLLFATRDHVIVIDGEKSMQEIVHAANSTIVSYIEKFHAI